MTARKRGAKAKIAKPVASGSKRRTKQQRMIELLSRPEGATLVQLTRALGWEPHTVHGAISGALKKKLGCRAISETAERGRVYRIERNRATQAA